MSLPNANSATPLPNDRLESVEGWGMSASSAAFVYRPSTVQEIQRVFQLARRTGRTVALRGGGRSYGDASLNAEQIVLDLTRYNRILEWAPGSGIITAESGATIKQVWQYALSDGWWPPVVPGTMFPTLGGCAAMNIHGKNNFCAGPIGEHILEFELLSPRGEILRCSPDMNSDLFHAAIGGFGMLGCFLRITLQMKRVYSGLLQVQPVNVPDIGAMIRCFQDRREGADYLVGWIDAFATGRRLGRGVVHQANYLVPGEDPNPAQTLRTDHQRLPDAILNLLPKSIIWKLARPLTNDFGIRLINAAKFTGSRLLDRGGTFRQSHAAFAFLLDYVPDWKRSYGRGGLIQYQSFIPEDFAREVFSEQIRLAQREKLTPYLAVFKRHRRDDFLMSHGVDGYSLAMDFRITERTRARTWELAHRLDEMVLQAGGRFYLPRTAR